jgi:hypothetical protein
MRESLALNPMPASMPLHDYVGLTAVAIGILRFACLPLLVRHPDDTTMGRSLNITIRLLGVAYLNRVRLGTVAYLDQTHSRVQAATHSGTSTGIGNRNLECGRQVGERSRALRSAFTDDPACKAD